MKPETNQPSPSPAQNHPIAKASVRRRLWAHLALEEGDGEAMREPGLFGDTIVLALRPRALARVSPRAPALWEGFKVRVRPAEAAEAW